MRLLGRGGRRQIGPSEDDKIKALFLMAIALAIVGWGLPIASTVTVCQVSPSSPCWTQVQKGFATCTVAIGGRSCLSTVTFSPAYAAKPTFIGETLNSTSASSSSAITVTSTGSLSTSQGFTFQAVNFTNWINMPTTFTELNGKPDQRASWITPAGFSSSGVPNGILFCANFVNGTAPTLKVQRSTNQISWVDVGIFADGDPINPGSFPSTTCAAEQTANNEFVASTQYYFRVMGAEGGLSCPPCNDGIGVVAVQIIGSATTSITTVVACQPTYATFTAASVAVGVVCGPIGTSAVNAKTFVVDWWVGVKA